MKLQKILVLTVWIASLGISILPTKGMVCQGDCCYVMDAGCDMQGMDDDCPAFQTAPLHPIPAAPIQVVSIEKYTTHQPSILTVTADNELLHPVLQVESYPLRLPPPQIYLLI
jgi:hypothetical protein